MKLVTGGSIRLLHVVNAGMALRPFLSGQLRYMAKRGLEIAVCSPPDSDAERFAAEENASYFPCNIRRTIAPWSDLKSVCRLAGHIRRFQPHIVHAHGPKAGLVAMAAARALCVPVRIYHVRGLPFLSSTQPQRLLRASTRATCACASAVLSVSPSAARELVAAGCCPANKVSTLLSGSGNGVDAQGRFNPEKLPPEVRQTVRHSLGIPQDAVVLGFVGRVVRDKGITELLAAWSQLRPAHSNLRLMIVGPLDQRHSLSAKTISQFAEDPKIHWLGEDRDTPRLYAAMDLLVLPSYREGLGLVLLEASAMGLPVIATNIPGCIDAVQDGVTGSLAPPRDVAALAAAISRYVLNPELRRRHGRNGRARVVASFDQQALWEATYVEYCKLLGLSAATAPHKRPARAA